MSRIRRDEQGRAEPDQDPRPDRDGSAGQDRRPVPRRTPAIRVPARGRGAAPEPRQGRGRQATARARPRPGDRSTSCGGSSPSTSQAKGSTRSPRALTRDGIPSPSAYDPGRNRHRCGIAWAWIAVRAILANPRYTGRQVWNKQRKDEVLHRRRRRRARPHHQAALERARQVDLVRAGPSTSRSWMSRRSSRRRRSAARGVPLMSGPRGAHPGRTRSGASCAAASAVGGCRAAGTTAAAYYRCVFLSQYAAKNKISHPRSVYLREDQILPRLDNWLTTKFSPGRLPATIRELEDAQDHTEAPADAGTEAAKQEIADCDASLRQHRAALEAGARPGDRHELDQRDPGQTSRRRGTPPPADRTSAHDQRGDYTKQTGAHPADS